VRLTGLSLPGEPAAWTALGFAVEDGAVTIGAVAVRLGAPAAGWSWDGAAAGELDGVPTTRAAAPSAVGPAHPNGALAVDHVVVASPDYGRTRDAFAAGGLDLRREREAGEARQAFFLAGPCLVELAGPAEADGTHAASIWGVTVVVADLDAAAARLGNRLGRIKEAVQPGRRIATARAHPGIGTALALMTPRT
jgi:hypothetical protein